MNKVRTVLLSFAIMVSSFAGALAVVGPVSALDCDGDDKSSAACQVQGGVDKVGGTTNDTSLTTFIKNIINVLFFVIGAIAVVMIIVGGIRYVTSNGDQANVKAAKDTIMYSVVGLVVALLAYAIVNFVVTNIK